MPNQSHTNTGTALPVCTHSDLWRVEVIGLGETPRPRKDKYTPAGEPMYSSGCILRRQRKDGNLQAEKSAGVYVINPAAIYELGVIYEARGRIYVMPWDSNGQTVLSITVEQLIPAETTTGQAPSLNGRAKAEATS
jgi:hypothetical protein